MIIDEVKELGFMDNGTGKHQSNTVVSENGLAPTATTVNGGGTQQIKVLTEVDMNPKLLGGIGEKWGDKQYRQGNRVYDANGVAMALTAQPLGNNGGNSYMYLTEEKSIVVMRGRNPENPSDRTVGTPTEQRLEPNSQGICNTLTSVTKDNLVMETVRIKQATKDGYIECKVGGVADLSFPDSTTRRGRVQDGGDVCPTLMAGEQDICRIEKADNGVLEYKAIDEQNMCVRDETFGTLTTDGSSPKHNNGVLEQYYLSEKEIIDTIKENNSNAKHQQDLLQCDTDICRTIPAGTHGSTPHLLKTVVNYTPFRIRKLTPRECGRLMGVDDEDIDKMLAVNSNSQAYKQYGNSIAKQCLVAIFSQMGIQGIPRWNEGLSEKYK